MARRGRKVKTLEKEWLAERYPAQAIYKIAQEAGCSPRIVARELKRHGFTLPTDAGILGKARLGQKSARHTTELPRIGIHKIRELCPGDSCIIGPMRAGQITAEYLRLPGKYTQCRVLVIEPRTGQCVKMFLVTRVE